MLPTQLARHHRPPSQKFGLTTNERVPRATTGQQRNHTHTYTRSRTPNRTPHTHIMSFFGMGSRPQISSEQKIAQAEAEIDMVSDMYSRYVYPSFLR
jgi:hypothetical protein